VNLARRKLWDGILARVATFLYYFGFFGPRYTSTRSARANTTF